MAIKELARNIVRRWVGAREGETILDARRRKQVQRNSETDGVVYDDNDLIEALLSLGIEKGDTLIVHSQWRSFYGYRQGSPEALVLLLMQLVGPDGNVLMPAYGANKTRFDVGSTASGAGVLSEVFRMMPGVERAAIPHFSLAGIGPDVPLFFSQSEQCSYGFDESSPYSLASNAGAKILLLGMGADTPKISSFHLAAWRCKDTVLPYRDIWVEKRVTVVDGEGRERERIAMGKRAGVKNNNRVFRHIYGSVPKHTAYIGKLDLTVFNSSDAVRICMDEIEHGSRIYKGLR